MPVTINTDHFQVNVRLYLPIPRRIYDTVHRILLLSVIDEGDWSTPRSGRFNPREGHRYQLNKSLGGHQNGLEKI